MTSSACGTSAASVVGVPRLAHDDEVDALPGERRQQLVDVASDAAAVDGDGRGVEQDAHPPASPQGTSACTSVPRPADGERAVARGDERRLPAREHERAVALGGQRHLAVEAQQRCAARGRAAGALRSSRISVTDSSKSSTGA